MAAVSLNKFFRIWKFLQTNPYPETTTALKNEAINYSDTDSLYRHVLTMDPIYGLSYPKDLPVINAALQSREKSWKYFSKVLVPGSYAYNTPDVDLFRQMTLEWSASIRTCKDLLIRDTNAFNLDDDDVDEAIKGFGIDFFNQHTLENTIQRQLFLLALCDLYKIKGSPESITKALSYAYVKNAVVREYWIERDPDLYKNLRVKGVAVGRDEQRFNTDTLQYEFIGNPLHYTNTYLTWQNFSSMLTNIGEPHWWYKTQEIIDLDFAYETYLKLPSLTPYFGIDFYPNIERYNILIAILEKIMSDQMNSILSGNKDLLPQELGVSGYNQDLSERDLWITGYDQPLTIVESFLAFAYSQIRYDEYLQYTNLLDFLKGHGVIVNETYKYPWAYQELIYWCWKNKETLIANILRVDAVVRKYIKGKSNYYCSTNQLIKWWVAKDPINNFWNPTVDISRINWVNRLKEQWNSIASYSENDAVYDGTTGITYIALDNSINKNPATNPTYWSALGNIPYIFFSTNYDFQFNPEPHDTTLDEILFYNGVRKLDYKTAPFEYFETIGDAENLLNTTPTRLEYDNTFKSYHASNRSNLFLPTEFDAQADFKNTYYDYISWVEPGYYDTQTHDGSKITPSYFGKYPKSVQWNWGVDLENLYICKSPAKWIKTIVERSWDSGEAPIDPNSPAPVGVELSKQIGYEFYYHQYVYKYVAKHTWIRYIVETYWPYCEAPISTDGHVKLTSDIAHYTIKAKIDASIAQQYLSDPTKLKNSYFGIILNPLDNPKAEQYDITKLENYMEDNLVTLNSDGYLVKDFSYYYENNYLYIRVIDYSTKTVLPDGSFHYQNKWVRKIFASDWDISENSTPIFVGNYRYPNLDLTDRYDAERILRGSFVLTPADLPTTGVHTGQEMLVATDPSMNPSFPRTWIYNGTSWSVNPINRINDINLGVNNGVISWIDASVTSESDYETYANKFLTTLSNYIKIQFQDPDFDIAGIFKTIANSGLNKNLINFFKPKRARLLYFNVNLEFDDRLFNSIIIDEDIPTTKLLQNINDYVPRNDGIYISDTHGLTNNGYHENDITRDLIIPINDVYGEAVYYVSGFADERVNGFYFDRSDLSENGHPYYLNYNNICLTRITNDEKIYDVWNEWIIALRKDHLHWCDAFYVNYSADPLTNEWVGKEYEPIVSSSSSSPSPLDVVGKVIKATSVTIDDLRECDITKTNNLSNYDIGKTNEWNIKHPRPEPVFEPGIGSSSSSNIEHQQFKTLRKESKSLRHWTYALCKNPINFRRIFPDATKTVWLDAGYPETIEGERITGYNADGRNLGINEYNYTFWVKNYPYSDDELVVHDAPESPIGFRPSATILTDKQLQAPDNYIAPYIRYTREIGTINISNGGSGYSAQTVMIVEGGDGQGFMGTPIINSGVITGVTITNHGTGYNYEPTISFYDITGLGSGAAATAVLLTLMSNIPSWWNRDPSLYLSGPVHHRPVYMALQNTIHDCYPCPDVDRCCDYYDTGCRHDGPTNPQIVMWGYNRVFSSSSGSTGSQWEPGQYSDYNTKLLNYDENTTHHRQFGYITHLDDIINPLDPPEKQITVREYWESENSWEENLTNPGDTYCTECDEPLFTPDLAVFTVPLEWQRCGVYHNNITATRFKDPTYLGVWEVTNQLLSAVGVNDFPVGYRKQSDPTNFELVHVYHKDSGYYYWELRQNTGIWNVIFRSELKEKLHSLDEIVDENIGNWRVEQGQFLNGDDTDVVEDSWTSDIVDPSTYIGKDKKDIPQFITDGVFETSNWIRFAINDYTKPVDDPYYQAKPGLVGEVNFEQITSTTGNLYICVSAQPEIPAYVWKVANNFEFDWTTIDDPIIRPDSNNDYFGYYYRNGYLYLHIETSEHIGWVRQSVTEYIPPGDPIPVYTGNWQLSATDSFAYRYVSYANTILDKDETFVCGNMVPYKETYDGIRRILELIHCVCHVEDQIEIEIKTYIIDPLGPYIKIKTVPSEVGASDTRSEHRFVSKLYEPQLPFISPTYSSLTSEDVYLLKDYLPFSLDGTWFLGGPFGIQHNVTWIRDGSDYYDLAKYYENVIVK